MNIFNLYSKNKSNKSNNSIEDIKRQLSYNEQRIYSNLKNLYISSFKWFNLPDTVNERFLELRLFEHGTCAFFKDEILGYLTLGGNLNSWLNVYGEPKKIHIKGVNGYTKDCVNFEDCIIIYNSKAREEDLPFYRLMDYACQLAMIEKTININVYQQRQQAIIGCGKKKELTVRNILNQYDNYETAVIGDESLGDLVDNIKVMNREINFIGLDLQKLKKQIMNEALSYIGIENNSSEKNERLTDDEVLISNGLAISNKTSRLEERKRACKYINDIFGLSVDVEWVNPTQINKKYDDTEGESYE
jgi:hypothetical protein